MEMEEIRKKLADRRLGIVSAVTGISRQTLAEIRDGRNTNPTLRVVKALAEYLGE